MQRLSGLLGHTVGLVSVPGRGCLFYVEILLIDLVQLVPTVAAVKLATPLLQGKQVLVVEDDAEVLDALATLFRRWGATVLTASHQVAALQVAAKQPLALIVSDYQLQGDATGLSVILSLREHSGVTIPALLLTGNTNPAVLQALSQHAIPLLNKPLNAEDLSTVVAQVLNL